MKGCSRQLKEGKMKEIKFYCQGTGNFNPLIICSLQLDFNSEATVLILKTGKCICPTIIYIGYPESKFQWAIEKKKKQEFISKPVICGLSKKKPNLLNRAPTSQHM
jgi:hypothetical protein